MTQEYDIEGMAVKIRSLRKDAETLKEISGGIPAVERNADRILRWIRLYARHKSKMMDYYNKLVFEKMSNGQIRALMAVLFDEAGDEKMARSVFGKIRLDEMSDKEKTSLARYLWRKDGLLVKDVCMTFEDRELGEVGREHGRGRLDAERDGHAEDGRGQREERHHVPRGVHAPAEDPPDEVAHARPAVGGRRDEHGGHELATPEAGAARNPRATTRAAIRVLMRPQPPATPSPRPIGVYPLEVEPASPAHGEAGPAFDAPTPRSAGGSTASTSVGSRSRSASNLCLVAIVPSPVTAAIAAARCSFA